MPNSRLTLTVIDYDEEKSTFSVPGGVIDGTNFAASDAKLDALRTAVLGLSLGELQREHRVYEEDLVPTTAPPETYAQRELKWLVQYTDDVTGIKGTVEIPVANTAKLDPNNKGHILKTDAAWTAFVAAFEDYAVTASEHNLTVVDAILVGRNI